MFKTPYNQSKGGKMRKHTFFIIGISLKSQYPLQINPQEAIITITKEIEALQKQAETLRSQLQETQSPNLGDNNSLRNGTIETHNSNPSSPIQTQSTPKIETECIEMMQKIIKKHNEHKTIALSEAKKHLNQILAAQNFKKARIDYNMMPNEITKNEFKETGKQYEEASKEYHKENERYNSTTEQLKTLYTKYKDVKIKFITNNNTPQAQKKYNTLKKTLNTISESNDQLFNLLREKRTLLENQMKQFYEQKSECEQAYANTLHANANVIMTQSNLTIEDNENLEYIHHTENQLINLKKKHNEWVRYCTRQCKTLKTLEKQLNLSIEQIRALISQHEKNAI